MIPLALRDWWQRLFLRAVTPSRDENPSPRTQAYTELREAEDRGDTRAIGLARMRLSAATHDQLSAEVWGQ